MDHDHTEKIYVQRGTNRVETGTLDHSQRIYQMMLAGFWKEGCYVASIEELRAVSGKVEWIEMIDLKGNKCHRISWEDLRAKGRRLPGPPGMGERWGVPFDAFEIIPGPDHD